MPRELSWYLEELRKKHTPGQDPRNRFDVMYRTLEQLDEAIRDMSDPQSARRTGVTGSWGNIPWRKGTSASFGMMIPSGIPCVRGIFWAAEPCSADWRTRPAPRREPNGEGLTSPRIS